MTIVPSNNFAKVGNYSVFYREAGSPDAPVMLLLQGFPSSSHQYRNLIPILATTFRVIAPDFPGFGFTTTPETFRHTFENIAEVIGGLLDVLAISKFSMYIFDYGAPTGFRIALQRPDAVTAIVSQNGNAYTEGLGDFWAPIQAYWASGSATDRAAITNLTTFDVTKLQYTLGASHPEKLAPEAWWLDYSLMARPGNADIQLDLFYDYRTNVALYPAWQEWLRKTQVPLLAVWGKHDIIFVPPGAEAFKRDLPKAEVHLIDAGHFALESNLEEISRLILAFVKRIGIS